MRYFLCLMTVSKGFSQVLNLSLLTLGLGSAGKEFMEKTVNCGG